MTNLPTGLIGTFTKNFQIHDYKCRPESLFFQKKEATCCGLPLFSLNF